MNCNGHASFYGPCGALDCRTCHPGGDGTCAHCGGDIEDEQHEDGDGSVFCTLACWTASEDAVIDAHLDAVEQDREQNGG